MPERVEFLCPPKARKRWGHRESPPGRPCYGRPELGAGMEGFPGGGAEAEEQPAPRRQEVVIVGVDMPFWTWVNVLATASLAWLVATLMGAVLLGLVVVAVFGATAVVGSIAERRAAERAYESRPLTPEPHD